MTLKAYDAYFMIKESYKNNGCDWEEFDKVYYTCIIVAENLEEAVDKIKKIYEYEGAYRKSEIIDWEFYLIKKPGIYALEKEEVSHWNA